MNPFWTPVWERVPPDWTVHQGGPFGYRLESPEGTFGVGSCVTSSLREFDHLWGDTIKIGPLRYYRGADSIKDHRGVLGSHGLVIRWRLNRDTRHESFPIRELYECERGWVDIINGAVYPTGLALCQALLGKPLAKQAVHENLVMALETMQLMTEVENITAT